MSTHEIEQLIQALDGLEIDDDAIADAMGQASALLGEIVNRMQAIAIKELAA